MSSTLPEKRTSATLVPIRWHGNKTSRNVWNKGFPQQLRSSEKKRPRTLPMWQVHFQRVNLCWCRLRFLRALKRERYSSACATVATSAAERETTQSFWALKVEEWWREAAAGRANVGVGIAHGLEVLRQHSDWPRSNRRHATLVPTNGNDSSFPYP